jgi:hypothetical protein
MAAEKMADMLVYEINGLSRPEYLSGQVCQLAKIPTPYLYQTPIRAGPLPL